MLNLPVTHSEIHSDMLKETFLVERQENIFLFVACDQTIAQTVNKDSKTKEGLTGVTKNGEVVHRCILFHHLRRRTTLLLVNLVSPNTCT